MCYSSSRCDLSATFHSTRKHVVRDIEQADVIARLKLGKHYKQSSQEVYYKYLLLN